jgi:dsRNA-specific ribonuclease
VQLTVRGEVLGVGVGRTKKEAEQMAAKQALTQTGQ